ncbi:hypothetical protein ACQEWB_14510 [Streptomyces sp. CA-249302]|uniref:hypothetical protein n=1 Tax=Streptomyces sp. CA-249302 TaxID=3240058 RepID=UPI003D930B13
MNIWPWGRRKRALARAEKALRDAAAGFYEVEAATRWTAARREELVRFLDQGHGLSRNAMAMPIEAAQRQVAHFDTVCPEYFADLDAQTPLEKHATPEELDEATRVLDKWARSWEWALSGYHAAREGSDYLDITLMDFFGECRPILTAASASMAAARLELDALAEQCVTSRPLRRSLREAEGELERLADGRTNLERRSDIAARGRRLHAEAEDIRRRMRDARPRLEFLDRALPTEAAVGP